MIIKIDSKNELGLYKNYIHFLHPILKVTPQEQDVLAHLMLRYNKIKKDVKRVEYINKLLFTADNRKEISEQMDMSIIRYDGIISKLRSMGLVKDRTLVSKIVPDIKKGEVEVCVKVTMNEK